MITTRMLMQDGHRMDPGMDPGWSQDGGTNCDSGHNFCTKVPCSTSVSLLPHIWWLGTTLAGTISPLPPPNTHSHSIISCARMMKTTVGRSMSVPLGERTITTRSSTSRSGRDRRPTSRSEFSYMTQFKEPNLMMT